MFIRTGQPGSPCQNQVLAMFRTWVADAEGASSGTTAHWRHGVRLDRPHSGTRGGGAFLYFKVVKSAAKRPGGRIHSPPRIILKQN